VKKVLKRFAMLSHLASTMDISQHMVRISSGLYTRAVTDVALVTVGILYAGL
jgi:hypothetical protein